jgi:hypothetical protein
VNTIGKFCEADFVAIIAKRVKRFDVACAEAWYLAHHLFSKVADAFMRKREGGGAQSALEICPLPREDQAFTDTGLSSL